jgi:hypothetical protein
MATWRAVWMAVSVVALVWLPARSLRAVEIPGEEGFVSLFDGQSLDGWIGAVQGYAVEDGAITFIPEKGGNLLTKDEYKDFALRLQFRVPPGGNNGVAIRAPKEGHVATLGMEIQILDNPAEKYATLAPYQYHGSVYGVIPAKRGYLRPAGEWNDQEIRCVGSRVTVILNGETIVDGDVIEASTPQAMDGKEHPGVRRTSGHVGFLGHGDRAQFRQIRIKALPGA